MDSVSSLSVFSPLVVARPRTVDFLADFNSTVRPKRCSESLTLSAPGQIS